MVTNDIESLLPHRKPFLFVDEIVSCDDNGSVSTRKFTDEDFFFKGHFPQYPVVPGVILVETMAQAGGAALSYQKKFQEGSLFFLGTVDKVKFRHQVRPGDTVLAEVTVIALDMAKRRVTLETRAFVGDTVVLKGEALVLAPSRKFD